MTPQIVTIATMRLFLHNLIFHISDQAIGNFFFQRILYSDNLSHCDERAIKEVVKYNDTTICNYASTIS